MMWEAVWGNALWVSIATIGFFTAKGLVWLALPGLLWYRARRRSSSRLMVPQGHECRPR